MNLVSGALTPFSFIFIRYLVQSNLSADEAGVWSSIVRISVFYMTFVSSICNLYFYPKLSKNRNIFQIYKAIIAEYYRKFIPIVFLGLLLCFVLQKVVILLIYAEIFLILRDYFYLQLIADFVKSLSLILIFVDCQKK